VAPELADDPADAPARPPAGGWAVVERIKARYRSDGVGVAATGPPGPPAPGWDRQVVAAGRGRCKGGVPGLDEHQCVGHRRIVGFPASVPAKIRQC
jgi:hypothetical protein